MEQTIRGWRRHVVGLFDHEALAQGLPTFSLLLFARVKITLFLSQTIRL
jgi:hypothetical protein